MTREEELDEIGAQLKSSLGEIMTLLGRCKELGITARIVVGRSCVLREYDGELVYGVELTDKPKTY